MSENPLVSIGMPVYNGEKHLPQALASLLAQSYPNLEIIVADNASVDNTKLIVNEFMKSDQRIRYYRHAENKGPGYNFDFTLENAKGQYFMWAAFDDVWDKNWIRTMLHGLSSHGVELSFGKVIAIDEHSGEPVRNCKDFDYSGGLISRRLKYYMSEEFSGKACVIYGLYRTAFLRKRKKLISYSDRDFGADMLFVFDCMQYGDIYIDSSVVFYKRSPLESANERMFFWTKITNSVLMFDRLRYYLSYAQLSVNFFEKLLLFVFLPIKYLKSLSYNIIRFVVAILKT